MTSRICVAQKPVKSLLTTDILTEEFKTVLRLKRPTQTSCPNAPTMLDGFDTACGGWRMAGKFVSLSRSNIYTFVHIGASAKPWSKTDIGDIILSLDDN